jgi:2-dehydro-3-deoxyglucarate aldolase/4-hydroxy-2-oxoheptanedioate aldolase
MVVEFMTPGIVRLAARAGADFVLFDMEHTGYGFERMRWVLTTARASPVVPFLRVPDTTYDLVSRGLDIGALGLMVPSVDSAEEARAVVDAAKYPPLGRRGVGLVFRDDWHPEGVQETLEERNDETLVIVQIETAAGLDAVEEIAAVEGIDLLWIGHFDLSTSLGIPGRFESTDYGNAVDRILGAGKPVGIVSGSLADAKDAIERGFRCVGYSFDAWLYEDALQAGIAELRAGL